MSMINFMKLNSSVVKENIDKEIQKRIEVVKDFRLSLSKRKDLGEYE